MDSSAVVAGSRARYGGGHGVGSRLGTAHAGNKTVFGARRRCLELMLHLALDAFRLLRRGGLSDHGSLRNLTLPRGGADSLQLQGDASHQETLVLGDVSVGGVNGDVAGAAQERAVLVADDVHGVHLNVEERASEVNFLLAEA